MKYLGGKARLADQIAIAILASTPRRDLYLETCVGGANAFAKISPHFARPIASDIHEDLVLLWQAARAGWVPPTSLTEEEYEWLRVAPPSALRGFAGFSCSFGGMWFSTYARTKKGENDPTLYAGSGSRSVVAKVPALRRATIVRASYHQWTPFVLVNAGVITIYCDPPYEGTSGYGDAASGFDSRLFWRTLDQWSEAGAHVFVSEYQAPPHWRVVGEADHICNVVGGKVKQTARKERLFTRVPPGTSIAVERPARHLAIVQRPAAPPPRPTLAPPPVAPLLPQVDLRRFARSGVGL